jgi:ankyrin repeat protein
MMNEFNKNIELYTACVQGNVQKVKLLIKLGVNLNKRDSNGRTLLHDASVRNHTDIIRTLVQNGANEYVKDIRGRTPLMYAAAKGHLDIVKYLIQRNTFKIPIKCNYGLVMIETNEYLNTVDDDGRSCLMYACGEGHTECVKHILDSGANVNITDSGGRNALMYACREGFTDLVQILIDKGISVNAVSNVGWSALHYSCLRGHFRLVKLLLENNINLNIENNMNNTAAYFAFKSGNIDIVKLLLENSLKMSYKDIADILWLVKFWTAFVPGTQFAKYEQFILCLCELFKHRTLIDYSDELTICLLETVYRTYMRQRFDMTRDLKVRNIIKYLLTLSLHLGHLKPLKLLQDNCWFNNYFNLYAFKLQTKEQLDKNSSIESSKELENLSPNNNNNNEIYNEFRKLLLNLIYKPPTLMSLCRQQIRKSMCVFNKKLIYQLELPLKLHQYLNFDYL